MKMFIKNISFFLLLIIVMNSCKKDNNWSFSNQSNDAVENSVRSISGLRTNFFKPKSAVIKGILLLGSGNDAQNPNKGNITDSYLIEICKNLSGKGFVCGIIEYRDQPFVGNNYENYNSNTAMLVADFNSVANNLCTDFSLARNKVIFGGTSYTANCLITQNAWGNAMTDIKGILGIIGSCAINTAQNQKLPILAFACNGEPFGTYYGKSLVQNMSNVTAKAASYGYTDNSCSGHTTSNQWQNTIVDKIINWIP